MSCQQEWNIAVATLDYDKIEICPSRTVESDISTNTLRLLNLTNNKGVLLSYEGDQDYEFKLPKQDAASGVTSLLYADGTGNVEWKTSGDVFNHPTVWEEDYLMGQPPAPIINGVPDMKAATVTVNWLYPPQRKLTISPMYVPVINKLKITIGYHAGGSNTITEKSHTFDLTATQSQSIYGPSCLRINRYGADTWSMNGTTINYYNADISDISTSRSFYVTISVYNYELPSNEIKAPLYIGSLYFITAGKPYAPNVTVLDNSLQSARNKATKRSISITPNIRPDDQSPTTVLGDVGAPSIVDYKVKYSKPDDIIGNVIYIDLSSAPITNVNTVTTQELTDLYPETQYEVDVAATNNVNPADSTPAVVYFTTSILPFTGVYVDGLGFTNSRYSSPYTTSAIYTYGNSNSITEPIGYVYATNWSINDTYTVGVHSLTTRRSQSTNVMFISLNNTEVETSHCYVDGFKSTYTAPSVTNYTGATSDAKVKLVMGTPHDSESADNTTGQYLVVPFNISFDLSSIDYNSLSLTSKKSARYATLTQKFYNGQEVVSERKSASFPYRISDVNPAQSPTVDFAAYPINITDTNKWFYASGLRLSRGTYDIQLTNIIATNMGTTYYVKNPIMYSSLGSTNTVIVTDLPSGVDLSSETNQFASTIGTITPASISSYAFRPAFQIKVNNINKSLYNTGTMTYNIDAVIDPNSYTVKTQLLLDGTSVVKYTSDADFRMGEHMVSPADVTDITTNNGLINAFNVSRADYNHMIALSDSNLDMMLHNGLFCTPSYNGGNSPYRDYSITAGNLNRDYSTISRNAGDYRYVTFRWQFTPNDTTVSGIMLRISGLVSGSSQLAIQEVSTANGKRYAINADTTKTIKLYYRFEDGRSTTQDPNGYYGNPQQLSTPSISSVWIDAHTYSSSLFVNYIADISKNTILGGQSVPAAIDANNITYTLASPTFNPKNYGGAYLYAVVGLPSDCDAALSNVTAAFL